MLSLLAFCGNCDILCAVHGDCCAPSGECGVGTSFYHTSKITMDFLFSSVQLHYAINLIFSYLLYSAFPHLLTLSNDVSKLTLESSAQASIPYDGENNQNISNLHDFYFTFFKAQKSPAGGHHILLPWASLTSLLHPNPRYQNHSLETSSSFTMACLATCCTMGSTQPILCTLQLQDGLQTGWHPVECRSG